VVEAVQAESGYFPANPIWLQTLRQRCTKMGALLILDEIQTGIGRTGGLLAVCGNCTCEGHCERQTTYSKPDMLILGKAISGGVYPVSAVLADNQVMDVITPGTHGSTFGGNPVAGAVAMAALEVIRGEKLTQNARKLGHIFRDRMKKFIETTELVSLVRGKGLLNAIVINDHSDSSTAWDICMMLKENGLLAKPTHGNIIRFAPPLVMTEEQLHDCCDIIEKTILEYEKNRS